MIGNGNNGGGPRLKLGGIHHANIKDKDKARKRLKAAFRKSDIRITLDRVERSLLASVVLSEVLPKSVFIFTSEKLAKNSMLTIHLREPLRLDLRARVRYSELAGREETTPKVGKKNNYRSLLEYAIASESEREAIEDFYQQVRDENYVATRWHHYVTEKAQMEAKAKMSELKIAARVKEALDQPVLATPEILVPDATDKPGGEEAA